MTHNPEGPGAYLGHEAGDSEGQQRYRAVSRDLTMTSANAREQQRPCSHAVYGMQEVSGFGLVGSMITLGTDRSLEGARQANYGVCTIPCLLAKE
jgi:hypothetical protein